MPAHDRLIYVFPKGIDVFEFAEERYWFVPLWVFHQVLGPVKPIKVYAQDESYDFTSGPALVWDRTSGISWWSSPKHLAAHLKLLRTYEEAEH